MAYKSEYRPERGVCERVVRNDAVRLENPRRYYVPTSDKTKWVSTWEEFKAAGGVHCFSEDHGEIELLLPEPYKFSIQFMDKRQ